MTYLQAQDKHREAAQPPVIPYSEPVPDEVDTRPAYEDAQYQALVGRLSRASVSKHFDAYVDVAWDDPEYHVDPADPRWIFQEGNLLSTTAWYSALPEEQKARLGLYSSTMLMKHGLQFESILKRGLLEFATTLPNRLRRR
jgi:hypothetical protein